MTDRSQVLVDFAAAATDAAPERPSGLATGKPGPAPALSIVIPVHNEVENIAAVLDELNGVLSKLARSFEVIVVDDGSTDGTAPALRRLAAERGYLRVIFFRRNFGQTAAFDAGFRAASGAFIVTMDGDLQNDPHDIPVMLDRLAEGYDMVAGWRRSRKDALVLRKFPSRVANRIIRWATGTTIHDLGCSLRAYRREVTEDLRLYGEMHRFISVLAHNMGARIAEVEVNHRSRRAGVSKYGLRRTFKVVLDLLTVLFMRRYSTKPIYVFGGLGFSILMTSAAIFLFVLWEKWHEGVWVHRNPLFVIAVMGTLVGMQLIATGLIAELIIRTSSDSQGKGSYFIADRIGFDPAHRT